MSKEESFEATNPKFKKAKKWSLKKLEKALDKESEGVSITKSTIRKLESQISALIQKCSDLVGEQVTSETLEKHAQRIQDKVVIIELKTNEAEIQLITNQLIQARTRLQDHTLAKNHLLDIVKRKNQ
ncbi:MAG: hypothetical protein DWC00_02230 [Candidatus Poseidoniales archaeon]|nr:MAG: hypothetical protein DWC00_02230 [Candidatus Poseidoniales archaeon]